MITSRNRSLTVVFIISMGLLLVATVIAGGGFYPAV
jgi:type III secretory pathway component EscS